MDYQFTQRPVNIECAWKTKEVTTNTPLYIPHNEFSWHCNLSSKEPMYVVLLLCYGKSTGFQKFFAADAQTNIDVHLSFLPHDWATSTSGKISLYQIVHRAGGGTNIDVEDEMSKREPKKLTKIHINDNSPIFTGNEYLVATINTTPKIIAKIFLVDKQDTEISHRRWKLKHIEKTEQYPIYLRQGKIRKY